MAEHETLIESNRLWLIVNSASGSNDEQTVAALIAAFDAAGRHPDRVIDCADEDLPELPQIEADGVGAVAVFTGDGTVSAIIPRLEGWGGEALILPGGTANLLAKELHGDRDAAAIVAAFGRGQLHPIRHSCVRFPGHVALIEVLAGPGATWSDVREGLRDGDMGEVASKTVEAMRQSAGGSMVAITAPPLGEHDGYAGVRLVPTSEGLVIDGYRADTVGDYLKQGLALLMRDFREGPHDKLGRHPAVQCGTVDGGPIELMIDGERESGPADLQFELSALDVNLLASADG
jgi:Diacylglycerol kinase catalytic domain